MEVGEIVVLVVVVGIKRELQAVYDEITEHKQEV
jgi:hypothetical protein